MIGYFAPVFCSRMAGVGDEKLSAPAAARRVNIALKTWWAYVLRDAAPPPDGREEVSNRAWWWASTVDRWQQTRPGVPGRPRKRTD